MGKTKWMPVTKNGKRTIWFGAAALFFGALPMLLYWAQLIAGTLNTEIPLTGWTAIGPLVIMFILMVIAFTFGIKAIFKDRDRAPLLVVVVILMCPQLAFWLFMIIGETVSAIFSLH